MKYVHSNLATFGTEKLAEQFKMSLQSGLLI